MPLCGAAFDENAVPHLDKGTSGGGFGKGETNLTPALRATLPTEGFSQEKPNED